MPLLTLVSASALVLVGAYCATRVVVPSWRDPAHLVELDGLHVVMSAAMVAMLLDVLPHIWALALSALLVASVASPDLTTALCAGAIAAVVAVGGWALHQLVVGREGGRLSHRRCM